jgi:hypothetical protein
MQLRIGRKNMRTLYLQLGDKPSDQDIPVGFAVDWHTAQALCMVANQHLLEGFNVPGRGLKQSWEHLAEMGRMANWIEPAGHEPGD